MPFKPLWSLLVNAWQLMSVTPPVLSCCCALTPSKLFYLLCRHITADVLCMLQVKPEPEDTDMTADTAPSPVPIAHQPVKTEPPNVPPADPLADLPASSTQQVGAAAGGVGGNTAAVPSNDSEVPPAGSLTPESSAQVA